MSKAPLLDVLRNLRVCGAIYKVSLGLSFTLARAEAAQKRGGQEWYPDRAGAGGNARGGAAAWLGPARARPPPHPQAVPKAVTTAPLPFWQLVKQMRSGDVDLRRAVLVGSREAEAAIQSLAGKPFATE